jgi:hypothetical protein
MSRLDSFIRRLEAQRACIDFAARPGMLPPGAVFELGLGNGRTFDHLRQCFPGREIFAFDRRVAAHPDCIPDDDHLIMGDVAETLAAISPQWRERVAFIHYDLGSGLADENAATALQLSPLLGGCLAPGALAASDQQLALADCDSLPPPPGVKPGRYFLYRKRTS